MHVFNEGLEFLRSYPSAYQAAKETNIAKSTILQSCNKRFTQATITGITAIYLFCRRPDQNLSREIPTILTDISNNKSYYYPSIGKAKNAAGVPLSVGAGVIRQKYMSNGTAYKSRFIFKEASNYNGTYVVGPVSLLKLMMF